MSTERTRNVAALFFFLFAILFLMSIIRNEKKPAKGYGGSPGHLSPMEVEDLYNKHKGTP